MSRAKPLAMGSSGRLQLVAVVIVISVLAYGVPAAAARPTSDPPVRLADAAPPSLTEPAVHALATSPGVASQPLTVTITLHRTDEAAFQAFLAGVQDPTAPNYRHFLSPAQLADRFGPSQGAYNAVVAWLTGKGFRLSSGSADRLTVSVTGSRARAAKAFGVRIEDYEQAGRRFYANTTAPAVPGSIAAYVQNVGGLSTAAAPTAPTGDQLPAECAVISALSGNPLTNPLSVITVLSILAFLLGVFVPILFIVGTTLTLFKTGALLACLGALAGGRRGLGSGPAKAAASRKAASTPQPQKIGMLEYDTYHPSDVTNWLALLGADPSIASRLSQVNVNGGVASPGSGESEVLLDIATLMQLSPAAPTNYVVYDAPVTTSFEAMFNAMINDGDTVISNSWTACEDQVSKSQAQAIDSVLATAAAAGISVVNGAGDKGGTCIDGSANTVGVPADSPHATAVGGTTPKALIGGLYGGETWWDGSHSTPPTGQGGFGVSKYFPRPAYQNGLTSSSMRSVPDLAAIADPADGVQICQADRGGCPSGLSFGGTSMSAPEVAAEVANINIDVGADIGQLNPALYPLGGTAAFESATKMGSDFAHVGLGSPDQDHITLALRGVTGGPVDATASGVAGSGPVPADGSSIGLVDAFLRSANSVPIGGKAVTVAADSSTAVVTALSGTSATDGGAVAFGVTDTVQETVTFTTTDTSDGVTLAQKATITFGPPAATGASIIASPTTVADDGTAAATVTVYLQNRLSRPAAGKTVALGGGSNAAISPAGRQAVTDASGQATFTATDTSQESVAFTAVDVTDGNLPVPGSAVVNFTSAVAGCNNIVPTPVGGFSASAFATGFAFNTSTIVFPGNITYPACTGQSPPAFDSAGNAYIANQTDGSIHVFGPGGGAASAGNQLPGASFPPGSLGNLVFGKDGSLYAGLAEISTGISSPKIVQLDPSTGATTRVVASAATGLPDCPFVLAVDPLSGDLFTDDECSGFAANNQITRIANPSSATPTASAYVTTGGGNLGLAFAPDGTIYLVNVVAATIDRIGGTNTASPSVTTVASVPSGPKGIPSSVAVASVGASGKATALDVFSFGGTVSQIDLTQAPPAVATVATGTSEYFIQATTAGACVYAPLPGAVIRFGPPSCGSSPPTVSGPQISLSGTGLSQPGTGSPVTFTASLTNVAAPAGTAIRFAVTGANPQAKLVLADARGQATFSYAGVFPGTDTVTASAVAGGKTISSAPVAFRWVAGRSTTFLSLNQSPSAGPAGRPVLLTTNLADISQTPPTPIAGAPVSISLVGQTCTATTDGAGNGSCALTPAGPPGLVAMTSVYGGSSRYGASSSADVFNVVAAGAGQPPAITSPASTTFTVGSAGSFAVVATGTPAPVLNETGALPAGVTFTAATGALAGTPAAGTVGTYPLTLGASNGITPDATQSFVLTVAKASTATTLSVSSATSGIGQPVTFTAHVAPSTGNALTPTGAVSFFLDGAPSPATTVALAGGEAVFSTSGLGAGAHSMIATYNGDANFAASTSARATSNTIACTTTITGNHPGSVAVPSGSVCIVGAQIGGAVIVAKGASIDIENSTVTGSIGATNGPASLRLCGSRVSASVNVRAATGLVVIGDPGDAACAPNTIAGTLLLQSNTGGVEAIGNTVGGLVTAGNSGPGPFPGDLTTISGNVMQ